jgi:WD40 repeat protein
MPTVNDSVTALLVRWEESCQQGRVVSPEELCRDCPELLEAVRARIAALESMGQLLRTSPSSSLDTSNPACVSNRLEGHEGLDRLRPGAEPVPGYQLVGQIGRGGFGEVWEARGPGGVAVALKFVPCSAGAGNAEVRSLQVIKGLRHPNLIALFGVWGTTDLVVIAMELAERTLWDRLRQSVRDGLPGIPREELLEYTRQAAAGIDYLNAPRHQFGGKQGVGVQHRDIKPQNLLLVGGGVKVADLGLARLVGGGATGHSGSLTVQYAAPEFFEGRTTAWSDQYSLAVTYCVLRGGRPPFTGGLAQVMAGHLQRPPDLTMVPEAERLALARALAKPPQDRWPTCRAFVEALAHVGAGRKEARAQAEAIPLGRPGPRRKPSARLWLASGATVALLAVAAGALALVAHHGYITSGEVSAPSPRDPSADGPKPLGEIRRFAGHSAGVVEATFAPDGRTAVSGGKDRTVRLWDVGTGQEIRRLAGHTGSVLSVCFTPDGLHVVSGSSDRTLRLWDAGSGKEVRRYQHNAGLGFFSRVTPDGDRIIASANDDYIHIWDLESGQEERYIGLRGAANVSVAIVAYSADGRLALSSGSDSTVRLWDVDQGAMVRALDGQSRDAALSADGRVALAFGQDGHMRLYGTDNGRMIRRFERGPAVAHAASFSPDGRRVLASYEMLDDAGLWDVQSGRETHRLVGQAGGISRIVFSPDGSKALSAGNDGTLRLWELPD